MTAEKGTEMSERRPYPVWSWHRADDDWAQDVAEVNDSSSVQVIER
jgi:hypothetical protein